MITSAVTTVLSPVLNMLCLPVSLLPQAANEKLARTTTYLEEEKQRAEALLYRMSGLLACFPAGPERRMDGYSNGDDRSYSPVRSTSDLLGSINHSRQSSTLGMYALWGM